MATRRRGIGGKAARLAVIAFLAGLMAAACTDDDGAIQTGTTVAAEPGTDASPAGPSSTTATTGEQGTTTATADEPVEESSEGVSASDEPVLLTPCFVTGPELVLPQDWDWIAADVSSGNGDCLFVLQQKDRADTTVIAGELFLSSAGRSFDEFVSQLEEGLAVGQEPDILALQLLNSGATGRNLSILERIELDEPNRAVILVHESDRRGGYVALSAVVDVPTESDQTVTHAIKLWGLLLPPDLGEPRQSPNYQLAIDLINSMRIDPQ